MLTSILDWLNAPSESTFRRGFDAAIRRDGGRVRPQPSGVEIVRDYGPGGDFTLYQPRTAGNYGLVVWGNGTGASPRVYDPFLSSLAAAGLVVIAANTPMAGSGQDMKAGMEYMLDKPGLNGRVAAMGHSQGGGGAWNLAADSRVTTLVGINPYVPRSKSSPVGPAFLIAGDRDTLVRPKAVEKLFASCPIGSLYGLKSGANHFDAILSGKAYVEAVTAWCRWKLNGDEAARIAFEKAVGDGWTVKTK